MAHQLHTARDFSYLANLNLLHAGGEPPSDADPDLSLFTNSQFFDFDTMPHAGASNGDQRHRQQDTRDEQQQQQQHPQGPSSLKADPLTDHDLGLFNLQQFGFNQESLPVLAQDNTPAAADQSVSAGESPAASKKRKASTPADSEEASRMAAEEDKRRRNTAASARFRVKKKQREQQLEKTAKDMTDRAQQLEAKVTQLELENKWLRNLITERTVGGETSLGLTELLARKAREEQASHGK